jgi:hypothetical protein
MAMYGRDVRVTRPIATMFRDARAVPRASGKLAEDLVAASKDPSEVVRIAFGLTDAVAGRMLPRPEPGTWGPTWLPASTPPRDALVPVLETLARRAGGAAPVLDEATTTAWRALPEAVQRLVVTVLVGSAEALPWLRAAFDEPFLAAAVGAKGRAGLTVRDLYRLATRPWADEDETDDVALSRAAFEALGRVDRDYLAYASVVHALHLHVALEGWRKAAPTTPLGALRVLGPGDDAVAGADGPALLVVDLGGKDTYRGRVGVPSFPSAPIST